MERQKRLEKIKRSFLLWAYEVETDNSRLNYDINRISEDLACELLNAIYGYEFLNLNDEKKNYPSIDLGDSKNAVACQVTSETGSSKIIKTLEAYREISNNEYSKRIIILYLKMNMGKITSKKIVDDAFFSVTDDRYDFNRLIIDIEKIILDDRKYKKIMSILHKYYPENESSNKENYKFLKSPDVLIDNFFRGRDDSIEDLDELINKHERVLVSGVAGIGKTQVLRKVYRRYVDRCDEDKSCKFSKIGYLDYNNSLDDSLVIALGLNAQKGETYQDIINEAWKIIEDISSNNKMLLIIDNLNKMEYEDNSLTKLRSLACTVIIGSRINEISGYHKLDIKSLRREDCVSLFKEIYKDDIDSYEDLLMIIDNITLKHTKTINLLARISKNKCWEISELYRKLKEQKFDIKYVEMGNQTTINNEYQKLFSMVNLDSSEKNILEGFALLSTISLSVKECYYLFGTDSGKNDDDDVIYMLYEKGWLERDLRSYSIHPLISEMIRKKGINVENHIGLIKAVDELIAINRNSKDYACMYKTFSEKEILANSLMVNFSNCDNLQFFHLMSNAATLYREMSEFNKAHMYYEKVLNLYIMKLGEENDVVATLYNNIGSLLEAQSKYAEAEKHYNKAVIIRKAIKDFNSPEVGVLYRNFGELYRIMNQYERALQYHQKSLEIIECNFDECAIERATSYNQLATLYQSNGKYDEALCYYNKALLIIKKHLGQNHFKTGITIGNIASVYRMLGKYDIALSFYNESLNITQSIYGHEHFEVATTLNNIGDLLRLIQKYDDAERYLKEALEIRVLIFEENHHVVAETCNNLGVLYCDMMYDEKAKELFERALAINKNTVGENHISTSQSLNNIAALYNNNGKHEKAYLLYKRVLDIRTNIYSNHHPEVAKVYNNIAFTLKCQKKYDLAEKMYVDAIRIIASAIGEENIDFITFNNNLGELFKEKGNFSRAAEHYRKALVIAKKIFGNNHAITKRTNECLLEIFTFSKFRCN